MAVSARSIALKLGELRIIHIRIIPKLSLEPFRFFSSHQIRTFKTYRSLISDNQRNPTILSRLKEAYNQPGGKTNPLVVAQTAQTLQNESLTKLLNSTDIDNLTPEQKQQLKVAFAEGYLAGNNPDNTKKDGRAMKYLRVFQQLLVIAVFMGIFVSLFAGNNGSMFRYVITQKDSDSPQKV